MKSKSEVINIDLAELRGKTVGAYLLEEFLDEGAFGGVFASTQMAFGEPLRKVAIKISKRPLTESEARDMFADAMMMTRVLDGAIEHGVRQRFVSVFDAGRFSGIEHGLDGHPFVVMEFIKGGSLASRIKSEGPFPWKRAADYLEQMLEGVSFMHTEHRIAHRDLKPENILMIRRQVGEDYLLVSDFGLAIETGRLLGWVPSGGTLAYLAPESFSRGFSSLQSDVYALGLIFHEMLTGKNPFSEVAHLAKDANQIQLLARQKEPFTEFYAHPEVKQRPALAAVIRKALRPDMEGRFQNAQEMLIAWRNATADKNNKIVRANKFDIAVDEFAKLCELAEQAGDLRDFVVHDDYLEQAGAMLDHISESKVAGRYYLLRTRQALRNAEKEKAGKLANKGYRLSENYYTCLAMAEFYAVDGSCVQERTFRNKAAKFPKK